MLDRVDPRGLFAPPIIITNADFRFVVAEQLRSRGVKATIVLEPQRRDSAAAIAAACEFAISERSGRDAAGGGGRPPDPRRRGLHCRLPCRLAGGAAGAIVTFGVKPTYPATNYGYIRPKPAGQRSSAVCDVEAFVEKPNDETAARYVADGYLWNSGNFMFRADVMLEELSRLRAGDQRRRQSGASTEWPPISISCASAEGRSRRRPRNRSTTR